MVRPTCLHLHMVPDGLHSYTLRTGSGRTDSRGVYGLITCRPLIVFIRVWTPRPRRPVMTRRPNAVAAGVCYLFPLKFVRPKVAEPCPVNPYRESVHLTRAPLFEVFLPTTLWSIICYFFRSKLTIVVVTITGFYLSTNGKPFVCYMTSPTLGIPGISLLHLSTSSCVFFMPSAGSQLFSTYAQPFPFTKYQSSFIGLFLPRTLRLYEMISLLMILSISHSKFPSMSRRI